MKEENHQLHLVLTQHWYDEIDSGRKREEYRDITPHWVNRLCENPIRDKEGNIIGREPIIKEHVEFLQKRGYSFASFFYGGGIVPKEFSSVVFHRGYSDITMVFDIDMISVGCGRKDLGASGKEQFVIWLGERWPDLSLRNWR